MSPVQYVWLSSSGGFESHTNEVQWLLQMNNQRPVIHQEQHKCTDIFILKKKKRKLKKERKRLQHLFTTCPFFVFVHCTAHKSKSTFQLQNDIAIFTHTHIPSMLYDYAIFTHTYSLHAIWLCHIHTHIFPPCYMIMPYSHTHIPSMLYDYAIFTHTYSLHAIWLCHIHTHIFPPCYMIMPYSHTHIPSMLYDYYTFAVDRVNYIEEIQTRWTACKNPNMKRKGWQIQQSRWNDKAD